MYTRTRYISIGILTTLLLIGSVVCVAFFFMKKNTPLSPPLTTSPLPLSEEARPLYEGDYVSVNMGNMELSLKRGTTTLKTIPIISMGKPGSYYETIGGAHLADYKIRKHFSSIGHVYMPWSTHVFGNFFIHGIPYYPDGTKVSSEYSGGCVRLTDNDAQKVYEFVQPGMPIVVYMEDEKEFLPIEQEDALVSSQNLLRYMAATISLEVLTQDTKITDTDGKTSTTRRALLPRLITDQDDAVIEKLAEDRGEQTFIDYMNKKASALGMTHTTFVSLSEPAQTTHHDLERFSKYLEHYKTYLVGLSTTTPQFFP